MKQQVCILVALIFALLFSKSLFSQQPCSPHPDLSLGTPFVLTCLNTSVILPVSSSTFGVSWAWSGPGGFSSTLQNPTVSVPGNYSVTVTEPTNGCTATGQMPVSADLQAPIFTVVGNTVLSCANPSVTLLALANPIPPQQGLTYNWQGPGGFTSTLRDPMVTVLGAYFVTVVAPNGCQSNATVQVTQNIAAPIVSVLVENLNCNNPVGKLTATAAGNNLTYLWSNGSTAETVTTSISGNYTVTVTGPNGCTGTASGNLATDLSAISVDIFQQSCPGINDAGLSVKNPAGLDILWSNGSTNGQIENLAPGTYCVTVTNPTAGCTVDTCLIFYELQPLIFENISTVNPTCPGAADGKIFFQVTGGTAPYTFIWNPAQPSPFNQNLPAGTYQITFTDAHGCSAASPQIILVDPPPIVSTFEILPSQNGDCFSTVILGFTGGAAPYSVTWSNGNSGASGLFPPGVYFVTITDANGCSEILTVANPNDCGYRLEGHLKNDKNSNCLPETAEPNLKNWIIKATSTSGGADFFSVSDSTGYYFMGVLPGNYSVAAIPPSTNWSACNPVAVTMPATADTILADLAASAENDCPEMTIDLTAGTLRRCFDNNFYYLKYCNIGSQPATDAFVDLTLDPFLEFQSSFLSATDFGGNVYRFQLGTVAPGDCSNFWVQVKVSCAAVLGQSHCSEAHIFPDTLCHPAPTNWSGANLILNGICETDSLRFVIKNESVFDMNSQLEYIVIEDGVMLRTASEPPLAAGGEMIVAVPKNGKTWRLEVQQEANHPNPEPRMLSVEGCANGSFSTGFVAQFPVSDNPAAIDIECRANQGSYDPNDKTGFPEGYGLKKYVLPGTDLEYLIRFQNTGTDTAFTVVVRDTLSEFLDIETVRAGASSHNYRFEMAGENVLKFIFENILLPDSNINSAASNGFLKFRISPKTDVPLETDIKNTAAIFFDFNEPVLTNTTVHRIGINFVLRSWSPVRPDISLKISPHPMAESAWLEMQGLNDGQEIFVEIFDLQGVLQHRQTGVSPKILLRKNDLPSGLYLLKISSATGEIGWGKLILR